jgi:hypothetical protein
MKRAFLSVVPEPVKVWAWVVLGVVFLIGLTAGHEFASTLIGGAAALVFGALLATWLLFVGFVFADAKQRGMRPLPWVLVAILFPHLLGFLIYFAMRQPLAYPCAHCGLGVPMGQRFCSWCGAAQSPATDTGFAAGQNPAQP